MKFRIVTKGALIRICILFAVILLLTAIGENLMIKMPGHSYSGPLPELSPEEKNLAEQLEKDVRYISDSIGQRNFMHYENLCKTADYIEKSLFASEYSPKRLEYKAEQSIISDWRGAPKNDALVYYNIEAELKGTKFPDEIIVIGAHYDSVPVDGCIAANDNASGVAAVLSLAKAFSGKNQERTIRFVAFTNEEPPYFWTPGMGSYVYAKLCREKNEKIIEMLSLETIGYYSDKENSQDYPFPLKYFYPSKGNFIGFIGNTRSLGFVKKCVGIFREKVKFPSEGVALPGVLPGVGWSDHWSFWKMGYPALMVTDTAPFRYPYYHSPSDTPDKIDYDKMARVVNGLGITIEKLANL